MVQRHIKKKKAYFWLTSVVQKRRCLNTLNFECDDYEWDSDYGNHRSEIVIVFDLYEGHWGVIFE